MKNNLNKKIKERNILTNFISTYKEKIDRNVKFKILDIKEAKILFPKYNGENPDFVIEYNGKHVGIEIFALISTRFPSNYLNLTGKEDAMNVAHLNSHTRELIVTEELVPVALEKINDKFKKLDHYVCYPIWLIGYVQVPYNIGILSSTFQDKIHNAIREEILKGISIDNRVSSIWLVEFRRDPYLLKIK